MKTLAFIDCETTGTDEKEGAVLLEVGLVLWSVQHRAVIRSRSWLVKGATENAALAVNGITPELAQLGYDRDDVDKQVHSILSSADAAVAYNVDFDRKWFSRTVQELRPWLCAMDDFDYPRGGGGKKLIEVALAHGVGVVEAHRALTDCLTMARLFERVAEMMEHDDERDGLGFRNWLASAARPRATFEVVSPNDNKDAASELGFRWVKGPDGKKWLGMRKRIALDDAKKMPFEVRRIA